MYRTYKTWSVLRKHNILNYAEKSFLRSRLLKNGHSNMGDVSGLPLILGNI